MKALLFLSSAFAQPLDYFKSKVTHDHSRFSLQIFTSGYPYFKVYLEEEHFCEISKRSFSTTVSCSDMHRYYPNEIDEILIVNGYHSLTNKRYKSKEFYFDSMTCTERNLEVENFPVTVLMEIAGETKSLNDREASQRYKSFEIDVVASTTPSQFLLNSTPLFNYWLRSILHTDSPITDSRAMNLDLSILTTYRYKYDIKFESNNKFAEYDLSDSTIADEMCLRMKSMI